MKKRCRLFVASVAISLRRQLIAESARIAVALSAIAVHDEVDGSYRPVRGLSESKLREVVEHCIEWGRTLIGYHDGDDRMAERSITGGQILAALRGVLKTSSCVAGKWRYSGRKNGVEVVFAFDVDDEGNLLIVVTVMRED